ncbi:PREDICTED: uncharacterized protein LOC109125522 [Camelina sativa]|uniref:Uncharacterized protein LOC109125522 n=1 Tax=Camelina sativa TaxID=90675 RepID=A0ABM1Q7N8_CAMSA|nr:PREDICTED: uncharacterized protein LOC109125522 [Camelina sativa]
MITYTISRYNNKNYMHAVYRGGYHGVLSLMASRLFSPIMHIWIISSLVLMTAWKLDNGYTNEGLIFAPVYIFATIAEVAAKILNPSDEKVGYITASLSHLVGGYAIYIMGFHCGRIPLLIGVLCAIIVMRLFSYSFDFSV